MNSSLAIVMPPPNSKSSTTPTPTEEIPPHLQQVLVPMDLRKAAIQSSAIASLCRLRMGDFVAELDDDLNKLTAACMTLGAAGEITIKIKIKPDGHKRIAISDTTNVKPPKAKAGTTAMFATPDGQMLAQDPDQAEFGFAGRVIPMEPTQARQVIP